MKIFKKTLPFSALAIVFLSVGIFLSDPRPFSFGIVWLLIASAKLILASRKENVNKSN